MISTCIHARRVADGPLNIKGAAGEFQAILRNTAHRLAVVGSSYGSRTRDNEHRNTSTFESLQMKPNLPQLQQDGKAGHQPGR